MLKETKYSLDFQLINMLEYNKDNNTCKYVTYNYKDVILILV